MKKLFTLFLMAIMLLSLAACGGQNETAPGKQEESGQAQQQQTASPQAPAQDKAPAPEKAAAGKGIVCVNFKAYDDARHAFFDHITDQSESHEIVSVHQSTAMPIELKNLDYTILLNLLGQSQEILGKFDVAMEADMLSRGWAKDAILTYDEKEGYLIKGTDAKGSKLEVMVKYDEKADSLRLVGHKDGTLEMVLEYSKMPGGYAAQYHYETVVGQDKLVPIYGMCTYRLIFEGNNGTCARFDNVSSEPESIFGSIPDKQSFFEGAAHWFTITDGKFTGKLQGKEF